MSQSHHQRNHSVPHSYNIQAKLQNGILSIFVHDTMTNAKWRQEFTQISFPGYKLYDVAKSLINAIKAMLKSSTNPNSSVADKPIAILVYNQWCYLTIHGSQLPSFALRPVTNKPYGFATNSQPKNIKYGDSQRDKRLIQNKKFTNDISKYSNHINEHQSPQKRHTVTIKPESAPKSNKNAAPPPSKRNILLTAPSNKKRQSLSLPPVVRPPSPNKPLPALPASKQIVIKNKNHNNTNYRRHGPSRSVKFGSNLAPSIQQRHTFTATNNMKFASTSSSFSPLPTATAIKIPSPPTPKKPIPYIANLRSSSQSSSISNMSSFSGISGVTYNSIGGLSHDLTSSDSSSNSGSDDFDEDDSLIIDNSDSIIDTDIASRVGSMDSNDGSVDSLFVNNGNREHIANDSFCGGDINGFSSFLDSMNNSSTTSLPQKKMRLFNVINTRNNEDDDEVESDDEFNSHLFDCDFTNNRNEYQRMMQKQIDEDIRFKNKMYRKNRNKHNNDKLVICLNGDKIQDMESHVIEMQITEEEFYEEEDQADEPFYDPNYLGISPYYDD